MEATTQAKYNNVYYSPVSKHADSEDVAFRLTQPLSNTKKSGPVDLDDILDELGYLGKFQVYTYVLVSFPIIFAAIFALSYVFTAGDLTYRCYIPECDSNDTSYQPPWLKYAVPFKERESGSIPTKCLRYAYRENITESLNGYFDNNTNVTCSHEIFNTSRAFRCNSWVYEDEGSTILREWDLTCDDNRWALTLVGTINNIGQFIGMPIAGFISDRIGRKKTLVMAVLLASMMGIARSFAWNYTSFLLFEFLDPLCGSGLYTAGFVLGMELVGPSGRVFAGTIISVFYTFGEVILGSVSMWLENWRLILRVVYIPALLCVGHYWLASESVRWLLAKGRKKEAREILLKIARTNGVVLPRRRLDNLGNSISDKENLEKDDSTDTQKSSMLRIFNSKILLRRLINSAFCWFAITFVFFGLSLNSVAVGGNKYTNFILAALVELPAYLAFYLCMDRIGRKNTLCASLIVSGVGCIGFAFLPADMDIMQLLLFLMGKFGITISFAVVFVFTAELFPTELRHSMLGACSMLGRIGSVIAPQTPLLGRYFEALPFIFFGGMAITSGLLAFSFPETLNLKLPDTIEEAENIGKKNKR